MGAVQTHMRLSYGYLLGGPYNKWASLANNLATFVDNGDTWTLPNVSWLDEDMKSENHPDFFSEGAEARLAQAGLGAPVIDRWDRGEGLQIAYYERDEEWDWYLVLAAIVRDGTEVQTLTQADIEEGARHNEILLRGMEVLELVPAEGIVPCWLLGKYEA